MSLFTFVYTLFTYFVYAFCSDLQCVSIYVNNVNNKI